MLAQPNDLVFPKLEEKTSLLSMGGLFVVIIAVLIVGLSMLTAIIAATKRGEKASLERKKEEVEAQLKTGEIAKMKAQLEGVSQSATLLKQALDNRTDWRRFFEEISKGVPKNITITNMVYDNKGTLRLEGESPDYLSVAKLSSALGGAPIVKNIDISSVAPAANTVKFSATVDLKIDQIKLKAAATATPAPGAQAKP